MSSKNFLNFIVSESCVYDLIRNRANKGKDRINFDFIDECNFEEEPEKADCRKCFQRFNEYLQENKLYEKYDTNHKEV